MKKNLPLKIMAAFTAISLMTDPGNVYAATGLPKAASSPAKAPEISETAGQMEDFFQGTSAKTILYIQDAHDSLEAQKNIASLISQFTEKDGVKTVFEEGYEGPVPTDRFFGFIPASEIREKVSGFLLDKLRIGGAEYAHINRKTDFKLIGADNLDKYKKNIEAFRAAAKENQVIARDLDAILTEIESLASQRFPKSFREWVKLRDKYDCAAVDLLDYLKRTRKILETSPSGLAGVPEKIPAIELLLRASASDQNETLTTQAKTITPQALFQDLAALDTLTAERFLTAEGDRRIFHYREALHLLKRLNQMEVTPAEYAASQKMITGLNTRELADFIARESKKSLVLSKAWENSIQKASAFYELAKQRDEAIEKTLSDFLQQPDETTAVLVYGGFHKANILSIFQKLGVSYGIITPKISGPDPVHERYYKELMAVGLHDYEKTVLPAAGTAARATRPPSLFVETFGEASIQSLYRTVEQNPDTPLELLEREVPRSELRSEASPSANLIAADSALAAFGRGLGVNFNVPESALRNGYWQYEINPLPAERKVIHKRMIPAYKNGSEQLPTHLRLIFKDRQPLLIVSDGIAWGQIPEDIRSANEKAFIARFAGVYKHLSPGKAQKKGREEFLRSISKKQIALGFSLVPEEAQHPFLLAQRWFEAQTQSVGTYSTQFFDVTKPEDLQSPILTFEGVYKPYTVSSHLFRSGIRPGKNSLVYVLGSGSGADALRAAEKAKGQIRIVASDIDSLAAENTRYNAARSPYSAVIEVHRADLFNIPGRPEGERADHIYFNPPLSMNAADGNLATADEGMRVLTRFLTEAPDHLKETGTLELTYTETPEFLHKVYSLGWEPALIEGLHLSRKHFPNNRSDYVRFTLRRMSTSRTAELQEVVSDWAKLIPLQKKTRGGPNPFTASDLALLKALKGKYSASQDFTGRLISKTLYALEKISQGLTPLRPEDDKRFNLNYPQTLPVPGQVYQHSQRQELTVQVTRLESNGSFNIQSFQDGRSQGPEQIVPEEQTEAFLREFAPVRSELRMVSSFEMELAFGDLAKTPTLSGGRNDDFLYENGKKVAVIMPWSKFIYRALDSDGREIPDRIYKITHYASENETLFEEAKKIFALQTPGVSKLQRIGTLKSGGMWVELKGIASARSMDREIFGRTPRLFNVLIRAGELLKGIHERGIVHGDIKPENLLINNAQELEWIDFGGNFTRGYVALDEEKNPIEDKTSPDVDVYSFIMIIAHLLDHQIQAQSPEIGKTLRRMRDEYLHLILKDWTFQRFEELLQIGVWTEKLTPLPRKKWPKDMSEITEKLKHDLQELSENHPELFTTAVEEEKKLIHASVHSSETRDTAQKLKQLLDTLQRDGALHPGKIAVTDLSRGAVAPAFKEQVEAFSHQKEISIVMEGAYLDDCCRQASWTLLEYARNNPEKNLNLHFPVDLIAYPHDFLAESDSKEKISALLFNLEADAAGLSYEVFVDGVKTESTDAPAGPQEPVRVKLYLWSDSLLMAQTVTESLRPGSGDQNTDSRSELRQPGETNPLIQNLFFEKEITPETIAAAEALIPKPILDRLIREGYELPKGFKTQGAPGAARKLILDIQKGAGSLQIILKDRKNPSYEFLKIPLSVKGKQLGLGFGHLNQFSEAKTAYPGYDDPVFAWWFLKNLVPFAKQTGFDDFDLIQGPLSDDDLTKAGFKLRDEESGVPLWIYDLKLRESRSELRNDGERLEIPLGETRKVTVAAGEKILVSGFDPKRRTSALIEIRSVEKSPGREIGGRFKAPRREAEIRISAPPEIVILRDTEWLEFLSDHENPDASVNIFGHWNRPALWALRDKLIARSFGRRFMSWRAYLPEERKVYLMDLNTRARVEIEITNTDIEKNEADLILRPVVSAEFGTGYFVQAFSNSQQPVSAIRSELSRAKINETELSEVKTHAQRVAADFGFPSEFTSFAVLDKVHAPEIDPDLTAYLVKLTVLLPSSTETEKEFLIGLDQNRRLAAGAWLIPLNAQEKTFQMGQTRAFISQKGLMQRTLTLALKSGVINTWFSDTEYNRSDDAEDMYDRLMKDPELSIEEIQDQFKVKLRTRSELRALASNNADAPALLEAYPKLKQISDAWEEFLRNSEVDRNKFLNAYEGGAFVRSPFQWMNFMKENWNLNAQSRILDVGSGNGLAAMAFNILTGAQVTSIEIDPMRWVVLQNFLTFLKDQKGLEFPGVRFEQGDFLKYPLEGVDFIYFYYTHPVVHQARQGDAIVDRLENDLPQGAVFVSPGFYLEAEYSRMLLRRINREAYFAETSLHYREARLPPGNPLQHTRTAVVLTKRMDGAIPENPPRSELRAAEIPAELAGFNSNAPLWDFLKSFGIDPSKAKIEKLEGPWGRVRAAQHEVFGVLPGSELDAAVMESAFAVFDAQEIRERLRQNGHPEDSALQYLYLLTHENKPAAFVWAIPGAAFEPIYYYPLRGREQQALWPSAEDRGSDGAALTLPPETELFIRHFHKKDYGKNPVMQGGLPLSTLGQGLPGAQLRTFEEGLAFPTVFSLNHASSKGLVAAADLLINNGVLSVRDKTISEIGSGAGWIGTQMTLRGAREAHLYDLTLIKAANAMSTAKLFGAGERVHTYRSKSADILPSSDVYFWNIPDFSSSARDLSGSMPLDQKASIDVNNRIRIESVQKVFHELLNASPASASFLVRINPLDESAFRGMLKESGWEIHPKAAGLIQNPGRGGSYFLLRPELQGAEAKTRQAEDKLSPGLQNNPELLEAFREIGRDLLPLGNQMPVLLVEGMPGSGKSSRAKDLKAVLESEGRRAVIIHSESYLRNGRYDKPLKGFFGLLFRWLTRRPARELLAYAVSMFVNEGTVANWIQQIQEIQKEPEGSGFLKINGNPRDDVYIGPETILIIEGTLSSVLFASVPNVKKLFLDLSGSKIRSQFIRRALRETNLGPVYAFFKAWLMVPEIAVRFFRILSRNFDFILNLTDEKSPVLTRPHKLSGQPHAASPRSELRAEKSGQGKDRLFDPAQSPGELTAEEKEMIRQTQRTGLFRAGPLDETKPLWLFGEQDVMGPFIAGHLGDAAAPLIKPELYAGKKVLVVPGYGNLPFLLRAFGAREVTAMDLDPATIAWQKLKWKSGTEELQNWLFVTETSRPMIRSHHRSGWVSNLDQPPAGDVMDHMTFQTGNILNPIPLSGEKYDLVVIPYLFGFAHGLVTEDQWDKVLENLAKVLTPEGRVILVPGKMDLSKFRESDEKSQTENYQIWLNDLERKGWKVSHSKRYGFHNILGYEPVSAGFSILTPRSELRPEELGSFFQKVRDVFDHLPADFKHRNVLGYEFKTPQEVSEHLGGLGDEVSAAVAGIYHTRGFMMGSESIDPQDTGKPVHSRTFWIDPSNPNFRFAALLEVIKRGTEAVEGVYDQRDTEAAVNLLRQHLGEKPEKQALTAGLASFSSWRTLLDEVMVMDQRRISRSELRTKTQVEMNFDVPVEISGLAELIAKAPTIEALAQDPAQKIRRFPDGTYGNLYDAPFGHYPSYKILWQNGDLTVSHQLFKDHPLEIIYFSAAKQGSLFSLQIESGKIKKLYAYDPSRIEPFIFSPQSEGMPFKEEVIRWLKLKKPDDAAIKAAYARVEKDKADVWENLGVMMMMDQFDTSVTGKAPEMLASDEAALTARIKDMHHGIFWEQDLFQFTDGSWAFLDGKSGLVPNLEDSFRSRAHISIHNHPMMAPEEESGISRGDQGVFLKETSLKAEYVIADYGGAYKMTLSAEAPDPGAGEKILEGLQKHVTLTGVSRAWVHDTESGRWIKIEYLPEDAFQKLFLEHGLKIFTDVNLDWKSFGESKRSELRAPEQPEKSKEKAVKAPDELQVMRNSLRHFLRRQLAGRPIDPSKYVFISDFLPYRILAARNAEGKILGFAFGKKGNRRMHSLITEEGHEPSGFLHEKDEHGVRIITYVTEGDKNYKEDEFVLGRYGDVYRLKIEESGGTPTQQAIEYASWMPSYMLTKAQEVEALSKILGPQLYAGLRQFLPPEAKLVLAPGMEPEARMTYWPSVQGSIRSREEVFGGLDHEGFDVAHIQTPDAAQRQLKEGTPIQSLVNERGRVQWVFEDNVQSTAIVLSDLVMPIGSTRMLIPKNPDDVAQLQRRTDGTIGFPESVEVETVETPGERYRIAFVYTHLKLEDWVRPGAEIKASDPRTLGTIERHRKYPFSPVVPHLHFAVMLFKESEIGKYPSLNYDLLNSKLGPNKTVLYVNPLSLLDAAQRTDLFVEGDAARPGFRSAAIQALDPNALKSVRARLAHTLLGIPVWTAASPAQLSEEMQQSDLVIHQTPAGWEILLSGLMKDKLLHLKTTAADEDELIQLIEAMDLQLRRPKHDALGLSMKETKTMTPSETVEAIRSMASREEIKDHHDSAFIDVVHPDFALVNIGYGVHAGLLTPSDSKGFNTDTRIFFFRIHYRPDREIHGQKIPEYLVIKPPYLVEDPSVQKAGAGDLSKMEPGLYTDLISLARFLLAGGFPENTKIRVDEFDNFPNILGTLALHEEDGALPLARLSALPTELARSELRAAGETSEAADQKESLLPSLWAGARSAFGKRVFSYEEFTAKAFPVSKAVFRSQFELLETLGLARVERAEGISGRPLRVRLTRAAEKWTADKRRIHEEELDFLLHQYSRPGDEEIIRPQVARVLSGEQLFKLPVQADSYEKQEIDMSRDDYFFPGLVITFRTLRNYFGKEYVKASALAELLNKNDDKGRALRKWVEDLEKLGLLETSRKGATGSVWVRLRQDLDSIKAAKIEQVLLESSKTKADPSLSFKIRNILEDRAAPVDQHKSAVTTPPAKVLGQWKLTLPTLVRAIEEEELAQQSQGIQEPSVRLNQVAKRLNVNITAFHQSILQNYVDLRRLGIQGLALGLPVDSSTTPEPRKRNPLDLEKARPVFEQLIRSAVQRLRGTDPEFAEIPIRTSLLAYELGLSDTGLRDPLKELSLLPLLEELGVFSFKPSTPALENQTREFLKSLNLQDTQELVDFTIGKSGTRRKAPSKDPSFDTVQRVLDKWINEQDIRRKQRRRDYVEALQRQAVEDYEEALPASAGLDEKKKALRALFPGHPALLEEAGLDPAAQKPLDEYLIPAGVRTNFEGYLRDFRSGFLNELGVLKLHTKINFQILMAAVEARDRTAAADEIKAERFTGFGVSSFEGVMQKAKKMKTLQSFWSAWDLADQYPPLGGEIINELKTLDRFYGNRSELRSMNEAALKETLKKSTDLMTWFQALGNFEPEDLNQKIQITLQISRGIQLKMPMLRSLLTDPEFKASAHRFIAAWIYNLSVVYGTGFAAAGVEGEPDLVDIKLLEDLLTSGDLSSIRESLGKGPENPLGIRNYANAGREVVIKRLNELTDQEKEITPTAMDIRLQTEVAGAYLGVDVGGGSAKWAVIKDGQILSLPAELKSTTTLLLNTAGDPVKETAAEYVTRLTAHAQKILAYVGQTYGIEKFDGVGIDIPGAADFESNRMVTLGQIPVKKEWNQGDVEWAGREIPLQMAAALDLDSGHVKIRNDMDGVLPGVASVLAQAKPDFWTETQGNFGFDWMGTGHGNQYAVGGVPMNAPTESGHMMFEFGKPGKGIFDTEAYTSIPSMLAYARALVQQKGITWHEISSDQLKPLADQAFYEGANSVELSKKEIALRVFDRFAEKYAANLAQRYTLARGSVYGNAADVLLGGGIARGQTGALLKDLTMEKLKAYGLESAIRITVIQDDDIRAAGLDPDDVGPVGSAYFIQSILANQPPAPNGRDFELGGISQGTNDTEINTASKRLLELMSGKAVSWIQPGIPGGESERRTVILSDESEYFQWRTTPDQKPLRADLHFHSRPAEEEVRAFPNLEKLQAGDPELAALTSDFGKISGNFFKAPDGEIVFIVSVVQTGENWRLLERTTKNRYDPHRGSSERPEGNRYSWYGALIASLEDALREMGIHKIAVLSSDGVKEIRDISGIKIQDPITQKMYGKPGPGYSADRITLTAPGETHELQVWVKPLGSETRSELRQSERTDTSLQKGTLLINADMLAGLSPAQADELFSRLYLNKTDLRLVVFNENGQVPLTPAFNAILKLPNVFKTSGSDYNAAGEKYGFPNSVSVLFLNPGEIFQPKSNLLKAVLLKKRAGEIEFARLLAFNGGKLPEASEENGVFDPPASFLSDLDQRILSTLVIAYSA